MVNNGNNLKNNNQKKQLSNSVELDFIDLIAIILKNKKKIIYITISLTILGLVYAIITPSWYKTTITILPAAEKKDSFTQYARLANLAGIDLSSVSKDYQLLYPEIIKSNFILDRVLEHKFKSKLFNEPIRLYQFWKIEIDSSQDDWKHKLKERSKNNLRENYIDARIDQETNLLYIITTVPYDPILAADLANFILDQLEYYNKYIRRNKAKEQRIFIESGLKEAKKKLNDTEINIKIFCENNKDISSPEKELEFKRLKTEEEVQLNIYIELKKQLEIAKIEEIKNTETIDVLDRAIIPVKKYWPKRSLILLISFVIGLFLAILISLVSYFWNTKIRYLKQRIKFINNLN